MTLAPPRPPAQSPPLGRRGTPRRAVARWAWRMFRREWRQQALVLGLLTAAVAASVGVASAASTTTPVPDNAIFGSASHLISFGSTDPAVLARDIAATLERFESAEVITHRSVALPGEFEPIDYRAQDPAGPFGGPRLDLVEGEYPTGDEVAVTDGAAELLEVEPGGSLPLDGVPRTVVGIVENPGDLSDEFVLIPPSGSADADRVTVLVDASDDEVMPFRIPSGGDLETGSRLQHEGAIAAVGVLVLTTVGLLLVGLIAVAGFVVIAHRRMRQLGVLGAIGATERQLRLVTLTNGAVVGALGAGIGAALGFGGWLALAPFVERAVGYRVDELSVPWWVIAGAMLLAVGAGTAAAWWPAREVARVPAVRALSGRPPEPKPARRAAVLAAASVAVGIGCLSMSGSVADDRSVYWTNAVLVVVGILTVALAILLVCSPAIRLLVACVGWLPVGVRLAVGDLARYRARSAAALAAISLVVAIATTVIAAAAAAQSSVAEGNLPANSVLVRAAHVDGPFVPVAEELDRLTAAVDRVVAPLDDPVVTSLDVAIDPRSGPDPSFEGRLAISLAERVEDGWADLSLVYVATPGLLAPYGADLGAVGPGTMVITTWTGDLGLLGDLNDDRSKIEPLSGIERLPESFSSLPDTFTTTAVLDERGWDAAASGRWLVETSAPPTPDQLDAARDAAAQSGLTIEARDHQQGLGNLRSAATAAAILVSLAILAMTVGLVRSESGRDLRVLTATGAPSRIRRTLTATTAGSLAVLGVILGISGAYVGLVAGFAGDLSALVPLPLRDLALLVVGLPVLATVAGWLVSGRTVDDIARQPMT